MPSAILWHGQGCSNLGDSSTSPREAEESHQWAHFKTGDSKAPKGPGASLSWWMAEGNANPPPHSGHRPSSVMLLLTLPKTLTWPSLELRARSLVSEGWSCGSWLSNFLFIEYLVCVRCYAKS